MKAPEARSVLGLLLGRGELPWQTPRLRALADAIPMAAERSRFAGSEEAAWTWSALRDELWPATIEHAVDQEPGWVELAGACVAVVDVLAGRDPSGSPLWPLARPKSWDNRGEEGVLHLGKDWAAVLDRMSLSLRMARDLKGVPEAEAAFNRLRRPQIHALLRGAAPARVYMASGEGLGDHTEPEGAELVRDLISTVSERDLNPRWCLDGTALGRSAMAAMFARHVAESRPESVLRLGDIGVTGELDQDGNLLPVDSLQEKVRRFFDAYPWGTCFVPAAQVLELDALLPEHIDWSETMRQSRRARQPGRLTRDQWARLVPITSVRHFLVLLGLVDGRPEMAALEAARRRSEHVFDWQGRQRPVDSLAPLPVEPAAGSESRFMRISVPDLAGAPWGHDDRSPRPRRMVLTGRPGSGKSMVLRQLYHALNRGPGHLRGPALFVPARRFLAGRSLVDALAEEMAIDQASIAALTHAPDLNSITWLLVDGLDELPLHDRRRVVGLVASWPGPSMITTRGLPEQLPEGVVFRVPDLERYEANKVLEAEGRKDLAVGLSQGHLSSEEHAADPLELLRSEFGRTPLGLSLIALVWRGDAASRQDLLRDAILHLVRRGEADGRLSAASRRRFERLGLRILGRAAWRMLCAGRAILDVEDLAVAERDLGLTPADGDVLHEVVEHGGFVQPVGPGHWEFTHKSLGELAAARYLVSLPVEESVKAVTARIGEPSANEVLLHLAVLLDEPGPLFEALLNRTERWLTALRLATRALLEVPVGGPVITLVLHVLCSRLRIWTALPDQPLPGDIEGITDVKRAILRHRRALEGHLDALLEACHPAVRRWAEDPAGQAERWERAQRRSWDPALSEEVDPGAAEAGNHRFADLGQWLARTFELRRSVRDLLQADGGIAQLRRRGGNEWIAELPQLFEDSQVGRRSLELWWELRPDADVLRDIGTLTPSHPFLARILEVVAKQGTPNQRREALLRTILPAGDGSRSGMPIVGGLADLGADEVLALWEPAWRCGVLGEVGHPGTDAKARAVEHLYLGLLDDRLAVARWRAVVALGRVLQGKEERPTWPRREVTLSLSQAAAGRLRALARDDDPAVRIEALSLLAQGRVRLPVSEVIGDLLAAGPDIRLVAMRALVASHERVPVEHIVQVLSMADRNAGVEAWRERAPEPPCRVATARRLEEAREFLLAALQRELDTWAGAEALFALAEQPSLAPTVDHVIETRSINSREVATTIVIRALQSPRAMARRWGLRQLGWRREDVPEHLLAGLLTDPDPEIVEAAKREVEWRQPPKERLAPWGVSQPTEQAPDSAVPIACSPGRLDEDALHLPMGLGDRQQGATISLQALKETTTFEEAWDLLGRGALETKTAQDMDGFVGEDGVEFIVELAREAADENRNTVREAFEHIRRLYDPSSRDRIIDDLGHPSRGLLAKLLLSLQPRGRELLRAINQGDAAVRRVAELSVGTPLSLAVVDAVVDAIASGRLVMGEGKTTWGGYQEPELIGTLRGLGGIEAMVRLLVGANSPSIEDHALRAILKGQDQSPDQISDGTAEAARRWTLARLESTHDRVPLLQLLALCGSAEDAAYWRIRMEEEDLSPDEAAAVIRLVGSKGTSLDTDWLKAVAMTTPHIVVAEAVMEALEARGGLETARWMWKCLDEPPPCIKSVTARWDAYDQERKSLQEAARAAGDHRWYAAAPTGPEPPRLHSSWEGVVHRAVVRYGDDAMGLELAWRLARNAAATDLCMTYGRLPSHALLVLGMIESDPGEHVIPASVTGGGDEVAGSGYPERIRQAVQQIVRRTSPEGVRLAILEAMLRGFGEGWGSGESSGLLEDIFTGLGGPRATDRERLLAHLASAPTDAVALRYLARIGVGESELLVLWREHRVSWLPQT